VSRINLDISVSETDVGAEIADAIEDGAERAALRIALGVQEAARRRIILADAVWTGELLDGFRITKLDSTTAKVTNTAEHAPYVDSGVSGTHRKYDTPYSYTTRGPPIEELLPWFMYRFGMGIRG
jgi:hypothetical protein